MHDKIEAFMEEQRLAELAALAPEDGISNPNVAVTDEAPEDLAAEVSD